MRRLLGVIFLLVCLWGFPALVAAQKVTIDSSTVGKRITTELQKPVRVTLGAYFPVIAVWIREVAVPSDGSDPCPTGLTDETKAGILLSRFAGVGTDKTFHEFRPLAGWSGGNATLCAILDGGDNPIDLYISHY